MEFPFGVKNGGPVFQRIMDNIVETDKLRDTFVYFDNVIIGAFDDDSLAETTSRFLEAMTSRNMTLNHDKTVYATSCLCILGYCVGRGEIKPDPSRLEALWELPPPASSKSLQRALGFFAYYAKWVPGFSDKIHILKTAK